MITCCSCNWPASLARTPAKRSMFMGSHLAQLPVQSAPIPLRPHDGFETVMLDQRAGCAPNVQLVLHIRHDFIYWRR